MTESALKSARIEKWLGRISNADPNDLPAGAAQSQVNLQCLTPGRLTVRPGMQILSNYMDSSPDTSDGDIISTINFERPGSDLLVTVDASGRVKARNIGNLIDGILEFDLVVLTVTAPTGSGGFLVATVVQSGVVNATLSASPGWTKVGSEVVSTDTETGDTITAVQFTADASAGDPTFAFFSNKEGGIQATTVRLTGSAGTGAVDASNSLATESDETDQWTFNCPDATATTTVVDFRCGVVRAKSADTGEVLDTSQIEADYPAYAGGTYTGSSSLFGMFSLFDDNASSGSLGVVAFTTGSAAPANRSTAAVGFTLAVSGLTAPVTSSSSVNADQTGSFASISTSGDLRAQEPWSFVVTRQGQLLGVNGFENAWHNGYLTAAEQPIGMREPNEAITGGVTSGGAASAGDYQVAYRYVRATPGMPDAGYIVGSLSASDSVTATANQAFTYSLTVDTATYKNERPTHIEVWRTTVDENNVFYFIQRVAFANGAITFATDTNSDATLLNNAKADVNKRLVLVNAQAETVARAHDEPPKWAGKVAKFQDRYIYGTNPQYAEGTLTVSQGGTAVSGSGTSWPEGGLFDFAGRFLFMDDENAPLEISGSTTPTTLTLSSAATAAHSGDSYSIGINPKWNRSLFLSEVDQPESVDDLSLVTVQENTQEIGDMTNFIPFGGALYVFFEGHVYSFTFIRQPRVDADARLIAHRGCINKQCALFHEEFCYVMDDRGPYRMNVSGTIDPIGEAISDLFRGSTLDWANRKWWFVSLDPRYRLIRFHVSYAADSSTRPKRAIVYSIDSGAWWDEEYPVELGGAAYIRISGRKEVVFGGQYDTVWKMNAGTTDHVSAEIRGTATSATSTTLTDSAASFSTSGIGLIGAPVAIVSGTGKGQIRTVTANTGTQLTVAAWDTTPDATSAYLVGAIKYSFKSGVFRWANIDDSRGDPEMENTRRVEMLFPPTAANDKLDIRYYQNRGSTPENAAITIDSDQGEGIATTADDPDHIVDLTHTDGQVQFEVSGQCVGRSEGNRRVEVEIRGFQGDNEISVDQLILDGAE